MSFIDDTGYKYNFMELYLAGVIDASKVDDFIEEWHNSDSTKSLQEYLGVRKKDYGLFILDPVVLLKIKDNK